MAPPKFEINKNHRQSKSRESSNKYRFSENGKTAITKYQKEYYRTINGRLHHCFNSIRGRCDNPEHDAFKNYGGRGIRCLFRSVAKFIDYVVNELKVDPRGLTIDRIDNDGHYEIGNIRFVSNQINQSNRRKGVKYNVASD